jgi:PiT family inorganic phosphate transporter
MIVVIIVAVSLVFDFLNGFHDSANSIATVVTTGVLKPQRAVLMAALANFLAAFFLSTAVAATIGKGIVHPNAISSATILAGLVGACIWNIFTWYKGLPVSSSHALIGGLIGAVLIKSGPQALIFSGISKTLAFIFIAPLIGISGGIVFTTLVAFLLRGKPRRKMNAVFAKLQIASSFWYSLGHGSNDAQKTIGIISLTLFSNHLLGDTFYIPKWVIFASHFVIALGTYFGGWRIVKTMGTKIIHLKPFEGFCAEVSAAATIFLATDLGIPVSTTHVISGSIIGVGSAKNPRKVHWITTRRILLAWVMTIPASLFFGAICSLLFNF